VWRIASGLNRFGGVITFDFRGHEIGRAVHHG
jgi:hypothetical protein